ncbi:MAG: hypothetical protein E7375_01435 [Clostridiales bacterium]|nr:hypothetical protein [Clostridiales bacterium]
MKNSSVWTKTILSVYRYLERICGAIDKIVMQKGLNSSNITGQNYYYNNVLSITQKLIDLSERKITLINLKILTEETFADIEESDAQLLIQKYVDGKKFREIAEESDVSIRTIFRRLENAEKSFYCSLKKKGYDSEKLENFLEHEEWIKNAYHSFEISKQEEFLLSNSYLQKVASL